jgi:hypothetical protein
MPPLLFNADRLAKEDSSDASRVLQDLSTSSNKTSKLRYANAYIMPHTSADHRS